MLDDFFVRALIAGLAVAVVAGPVGCFILWRRMAYFGATLAHAALLGVALGLLLGVGPGIGILAVCLLAALTLAGLQDNRTLPTDSLLGIVAHAALALGLVALAFMETVRVDLFGYLFGDILAVSRGDLAWIVGGAIAALMALALIWRPLLALTVHEDLARVEGVPVARARLAYVLLIAVVVAASMKLVGTLLIVSLLIIPAAAARAFARTPEAMAVLSAAIGVVSVLGGLGASLQWDAPAGPAIVVAASLLFALSLIAGKRLRSS